MNLSKQECRDLAPDDWIYSGYWDGHYHFQTGGYPGNYDYKNKCHHVGFFVMSCLPEDMELKNLALMAEMRLTRII